MDTLVQADIFFFITAVSVVFLSVLLIVALVYAVRILKNVLYISRLARRESDRVAQDISDLRKTVRSEGQKVRDGVSHLSRRVREEGEEALDDVKSVRSALKKEGVRLWDLFTFFLSFLTIKKGSKTVTRRNTKKKNGTKNKEEKQ